MERKYRNMRVHYALIISVNPVIGDTSFRYRLYKEFDDQVLCVEAENYLSCIVVRGICDFADACKNEDWQGHAAAVAAAFAKELLGHVERSAIDDERLV